MSKFQPNALKWQKMPVEQLDTNAPKCALKSQTR